MRKFLSLLTVILSLSLLQATAQEFQANVSVIANRVPSSIDHKIFQTLQASLTTFINNRKWTTETFQANEKIICNFSLNISQSLDNNEFQASLTVQAARPIFNSTYTSPLINMVDDN